MDLSGIWRVAPADDELRRSGIGLDADDAGWEPVPVPGHWRSVPAFADSDGPLLYRTRFEQAPPESGERRFVVFDGIFYQADVWLDGAYLGDPEGYFFPHSFEVTALARLAPEHALAVEVTCAPQRDRAAKRNITGVFQHWSCIDPDWNPGGIWRPVRIESTGPVRIDRLRVLCRDANDARAHLRLHGRLDAATARTVRVRTLVDGVLLAEQEQPLARGANEVDWNLDVDNPRLWWPWSMGAQPLTHVTVEVVADGTVSHSRTVRTGLREVGLQDWIFSVNGERLFVKGANLGPTRVALGEATPEELRRDVELARDAGLDLLRVHGHITRTEVYDAADELGVLIWQDFPLQWGYARSVRRAAVAQATEAVDALGHHPSIAVWCAHNEPVPPGVDHGTDLARRALPYLAAQQLPTWNKTVLDRWVKRALEKADDTRAVIPHSGVLPHLPQLDGTDSHLYFGWYHGDERDLPGFAAALPRLVRFVSELGAQAVPDSADFMEPERWPALDWDRLRDHHALQPEVLDRHVPVGAHATFGSWREASQRYQATVLRHQVEALRRVKYRPTGGFCMFLLADAQPAVSWSVLDHERVPKLGFHALTEACRPVIVVADRLPAAVAAGQALALDVHVVNDLHRGLDGARVTATLTWPTGSHHWCWEGDVPADDCIRIGTIQFVVPDTLEITDLVVVDLTLEADDVVATNRDVTVVAGPE